MKKISIAIMIIVVALSSCKKTPEVNLKYVDVERDLVTVGTTTANIQCDYSYIATLKKAYFFYGEGADEDDFTSAEMRVVQNTLYVDLDGLTANTTYNYYYKFHNGFNSMRTVAKTFKTEGGSGPTVILPTVVTAAVTEITTNSAKGGGEVTSDGGAEVTGRGICWSTNENPTLGDNHVAAGTGTGAFTALMSGLEANTTYHVRAYAINEIGTAYGLDKEFTTLVECDCSYVDLGLPSGTLWATCNVGANSPEDYGDYFAWGETEPKVFYEWSTYQHCNGSFNTFTKYCSNYSYGYNGFTDNLAVLLPEDDAATVNLGSGWRMPTKEEWEELSSNTTSIWTNQNGVFGRLFTSSNGNTLFLPAAGHRVNSELYYLDEGGYYWSSNMLDPEFPVDACYFVLVNNSIDLYSIYRLYGFSVRAVRSVMGPPTPPDVPEGAINGLFTINENGDQVYFSQGNLQYQASTNTWRFAEHQWDYVGNVEIGTVYENGVKCINELTSATYGGWIDLFGWGTSGYNHGAVCYQPWSISTNSEDYYAYGDNTNNLSDKTGMADWGYNAIDNGGNCIDQWRVLNEDEWQYLLFHRSTELDIRFVKAQVNEIKGIIIFPDNWADTGFNNVNEWGDLSFSMNTISITKWSELEFKGAVFLPCAYSRMGTQFYSDYSTWSDGNYWSSTVGSNGDPMFWNFSNVNNWGFGTYGYYGFSVRLVQDAN